MARPLKGATKVVGPHPNVPQTALSHEDDRYALDFNNPKAQPTLKRTGIAQRSARTGRTARASQPRQVKSKGNRNSPVLS